MARNIALSVVSILFTVYLLELGLFATGTYHYNKLRTHNPNMQARIKLARQQNVPYDTRSGLEVVTDLREQGIHAGGHVSPSAFIASNGLKRTGGGYLYPLGGVSNQATVFCNEAGKWIVYESDDHGFRNPQGIYKSQHMDIILIGDSFTSGHCDAQDSGALLRRKDRKVLNLGKAGSGPLMQLAILREYGSRFKPKLVLWMYYEGNDLGNLNKERTSALLSSYLDPGFSQNLFGRQSDIDNMLKNYAKTEESKEKDRMERTFGVACVVRLCGWRTTISRAIHKIVSADTPGALPSPDSALPLFKQILIQAKTRTTAWQGRLYFIYLPTWRRYGQEAALADWQRRKTEVLALVSALDIPVIDFENTLTNHTDPLSFFPFRIHGHYTPEGYRLLAEEIERHLALGVPGAE